MPEGLIDRELLAHATDEELDLYVDWLESQLDADAPDSGEWVLQDRQQDAEDALNNLDPGMSHELLYGGMAGGGKSDFLLWHPYNACLRYPKLKVLILRRTFGQLRRSLILRSLERFDRALCRYVVTETTWKFNNGSSIEFGYLESDMDVYNYDSAEYDIIEWDELTQMPTPFPYLYLFSRLRSQLSIRARGFVPHMVAATNPGRVGAAWVKARFVDTGPPDARTVHPLVDDEGNAIALDDDGNLMYGSRIFLPATLEQNKYISRAQYTAALANLPKAQREALLSGSWDTIEGQYFCYDDQTEILAEAGWKPVSDVSVGEPVATLAPDGTMLFAPATAVYRFPFDGDLWAHSGRALDFAVTPGHKMYGYGYKADPVPRFIPVEELPQTSVVLRAGSQKGKTPEAVVIRGGTSHTKLREFVFDPVDFASFVGWWLAEGSIVYSTLAAGHQPIGWAIHQSASLERIAEIETLLTRMGLRSNFDGRRFRGRSTVLARWLIDNCGTPHDHKRIPHDMLGWGTVAIRAMFDALMAGDGCERPGGGCLYASTSSGLVDDIQELAARIGRTAVIAPIPVQRQHQHAPCWRISIYRPGADRSILRKGNIERRPYTGTVSCVTVEPFHTVLVRRNGRAMWSGNTEWSRELHVCRPFDVPAWWTRLRCIDYGHAAPFACLWLAFDNDGNAVLYRELYQTQLTPTQQAALILKSQKPGEQIAYTIIDPSAFASTGVGIPIAQQYMDAGVPVRKGLNARVAGWARVRDFLRPTISPGARPGDPDVISTGLRVFDTCANFIRTFPMLVHDTKDPEDLDTDGEDHAADALRYGLMSRPPRSRRPKEEASTIEERMAQSRRERDLERRGLKGVDHPMLGRI